MVCIYCSGQTKVTNVRPQARLRATWRRRQCLVCGAIFTSVEQADLSLSLSVIKRNGTLEPFQPDKLFVSIHNACQPQKDSAEAARALSNTIISKLLKDSAEATIPSSAIAKTAKTVLSRYKSTIGQRYWSYQLEK